MIGELVFPMAGALVFFVDFLADVSDLVDVCVLDFLDCDVVFRVLLGLGLVKLLHDCSQ